MGGLISYLDQYYQGSSQSQRYQRAQFGAENRALAKPLQEFVLIFLNGHWFSKGHP